MKPHSWKDDLAWLIGGTALQFVLQKASEWALVAREKEELAATLTKYHFFFAREILAVVLVVLLVKVFRGLLDFRGIALSQWLRSSALALVLAGCIPIVAHLDQILGLLRTVTPPSFSETREALARSSLYSFLSQTALFRWGLDLIALLIALLTLRLTNQQPDVVAARQAAASGDHVRAGDLFLKAGDVPRAKKAYRKGQAFVRVATLELRDGRAAEAAALYEKSGPALAFEASRAWLEAGNELAAARALQTAITEARTSSRWDRLAEAAEAAGDMRSLEEALRRMAEIQAPGPGRSSLFRRAGDAAAASGNSSGAAEAYRLAGESELAAEYFLQAGRPSDAAREFERAGDLARAAEAASAAGNPKGGHELRARAAEQRGDVAAAAEEWYANGLVERAATLFERSGQPGRAAEAYREAGRPDRAAPLFQKSGDLKGAAMSYEASGQSEKAAVLFRDIGQLEKAAALFQAAGKLGDAAETLERAGAFTEAIPYYARAGRKLDAARCALHSGHRDLAWENLMAVPRSAPGVPQFFLDLAEAHLLAGEPRDAVHILREILGPTAVDRSNIHIHEALARSLEAAGDLAGAVDRLRKISSFDLGYADAAKRQAALEPRVEVTKGAVQARTADPFSMSPGQPPPVSGPLETVQAMMPPTPALHGSGPVAALLPGPSGALASLGDPGVRYEIVSELGRGGMGVVHKALDRKLDRFVALKVLPASLWGDEVAMRYFDREAKAIATLEHPNVVALYDYGVGFGSAYLAMEYLDGPNLQVLLKSDPSRIRTHWRDWFVQASRGVAAAHAKGILHRDLKPANLMLDRHGTLRILDFGLARPETDTGMTSKLIGTPAFFPPEVLRGESPSPSSDVYSLAATFYTLATGRWPYVGDDVLVARLERDPDDPRPYAPFLSEDETWVLMKALARFRPERFHDAGELLGALLSLEAQA